MAGGTSAPTDNTEAHINPEYDSDEDGVVEQARDADTLGGASPSEIVPTPIYEAGEALFETVNKNETLTVPDGETWIFSTKHRWSNNSYELFVNGQTVSKNSDRYPGEWDRDGVVLTGGDTISTSEFYGQKVEIRGWKV